MILKKFVTLSVLSLFISTSLFASTVGISTYPIIFQKNILSMEFNGIMSEGGGVGIQGRYSRIVSERTILDAGVGLSAGNKTNAIFFGGNYEIYADYHKQPKVTIRGQWESSNEYGARYNIISLTPIISKGFVASNKNIFPHISFPYSINLNSADASYKTTLSTALGITGNLPFKGYENLIGTLEARFSLSNSYSGLFAGISFPVDIK